VLAASLNHLPAAHLLLLPATAGVDPSSIIAVFSDEPCRPASLKLTNQQYKKSYYGTISYIPALFGLHIASYIINDVVQPQLYKQKLKAFKQQRAASLPGGGSGRKGGGQQQQGARSRRKQKAEAGGYTAAEREAAAAGGGGGGGSWAAAQQQADAACSSGGSNGSSSAAGEVGQQQAVGQQQGVGTASVRQPGLLTSFDRAAGLGQGYDGSGI
jgi:hypothetical protein